MIGSPLVEMWHCMETRQQWNKGTRVWLGLSDVNLVNLSGVWLGLSDVNLVNVSGAWSGLSDVNLVNV